MGSLLPCLYELKVAHHLKHRLQVQNVAMYKHNVGTSIQPWCFNRKLVLWTLPSHPAEGCFYTYDLAKRDTEGNYQVTGRVDDAIRIKGVWLEVPKIESVMVRIYLWVETSECVLDLCSFILRPPSLATYCCLKCKMWEWWPGYKFWAL